MTAARAPLPVGEVAKLVAEWGMVCPFAVELLLAAKRPFEPTLGRLGDTAGPPMLVAYEEALGDREARRAALEQTWDWDAPGAVQDARAVLFVADAQTPDAHARLSRFLRLVTALVRDLPVLGLHWPASQCIVHPEAYLARVAEAPLSAGPVNVRFFKVGDGAEGERVMDTLGLRAFDLPDLQWRFRSGEPERVAARLRALAGSMFAKGDEPLAEGHVVTGIAQQPLVCRHLRSVIAPERSIIDLRFDFSVRCPRCRRPPHADARWECGCGFVWNTFDTWGACPACERPHEETQCPACQERSAHGAWYEPACG